MTNYTEEQARELEATLQAIADAAWNSPIWHEDGRWSRAETAPAYAARRLAEIRAL
jgi:hypothetical protein